MLEERFVIRALLTWAAFSGLAVLAVLFLGVAYFFLVIFLLWVTLNLLQFSRRFRAAFAGQSLTDRYQEGLDRARRSRFFLIYLVLRVARTALPLAAATYFFTQPSGRIGLLWLLIGSN